MTKTLTPDKLGRVTLPKEVLKRLKEKPEITVKLRELPDGRIALDTGRDPRELRGIIKPRGIHLTVEEIGQIIERQGGNA